MTAKAEYDVAVVGAGPAGLSVAIGCALRGLSVGVVDTSPAASRSASSGRSAALLTQTVLFLKSLGVWDACREVSAPLQALQFIDGTTRRLRAPDCVFHASEIGEEAFGYNIANADLVRIMKEKTTALGMTVTVNGAVSNCDSASGSAMLTFENGTKIKAKLAVAADGRTSPLRRAAGIRALTWDYDQTAVAVSFAHSEPHGGRCIEIHRDAGPFTMVPLPGNRSSLVWVEGRREAERLLQLNTDAFIAEIERVSLFALGRISGVSERARFPLSSLLAREYGRDRIALVGEAAHVTPPIGAQGLNLGFRDAAVLIDCVAKAHRQAADIGSSDCLEAFSTARRGDVVTRTFGVDALNRSLISGLLPFQAARGAGLYALGSIAPLRRAFMRRGIAPAPRPAPETREEA